VAHIGEVVSARQLAAARQLFEAYAASLDFDLEFQGFRHELATLPGEYAAPRGSLLLARERRRWVGCVALRPLGPQLCELKRLFVVPEARRRGVGRALACALIGCARQRGYKQMRLDTVDSMRAAERLYLSLGFRAIEPYCVNPLPGARFYELAL
jgi:GNAT superfamily N-acetyltransferase